MHARGRAVGRHRADDRARSATGRLPADDERGDPGRGRLLRDRAGPRRRQQLADGAPLPHARPFGVADPLFGQDVGFYVFTLPFFALPARLAGDALVLVAVATLAVYAVILVYELNLDLERLLYRVGAGRSRSTCSLLLAVSSCCSPRTTCWTFRAGALDARRHLRRRLHRRPRPGARPVGLTAWRWWPPRLAVASIFTRWFRFLVLGLGGWAVGALVLGVALPHLRPARRCPAQRADPRDALHRGEHRRARCAPTGWPRGGAPLPGRGGGYRGRRARQSTDRSTTCACGTIASFWRPTTRSRASGRTTSSRTWTSTATG